MAEPEQPEPGTFYVDGDGYKITDLTFKELRTLRQTLAEMLEVNLNEPIEPGGIPRRALPMETWAAEEDLAPVLVWIIRRRGDAAYNLDKALDVKPSELEAPAARPTKQRASK